MPLNASYAKKTFKFTFDAGTSRGILKEKDSYFIFLSNSETPKVSGIGEAAPLRGLSIDDIPDFETQLQSIIDTFNTLDLEIFEWNIPIIINQLIDNHLPSIKFAFETALRDYLFGGKQQLYHNDFTSGKQAIPINGLIWMGDSAFMQQQIKEKLAAGFTTLKMKVGAISFDEEMKLLTNIRKNYPADKITIRVDANGAFTPDEAPEALKALKKCDVHSIEQPIKAGQWEAMARLCDLNIVPVALDEELIGVYDYVGKKQLLKTILPQYIILKPTLLGGFESTREWISLGTQLNIPWWATSALESNIGLNAIAQFTAEFPDLLPQGLGTGSLYQENIKCPLRIRNGHIINDIAESWDTTSFFMPQG